MSLLQRISKRLKVAVSDQLTQTLYRKGIPSEDVIRDASKNQIFFSKLNCAIPLDVNPSFLIDGYQYAVKLKDSRDAEFTWNDGLRIKIDGVSHHAQTEEDIFILFEIHVEGVYNYIYTKPHIIADIGMNVGFSSLFFAKKKEVIAIHGFEPFKPTFDQAIKNYSLNEELKKKITPHNFGLGEKDESLKLSYNYDWKGSVGIGGLPERLNDKVKVSEQEILIKKIDFLQSDIFNETNLPIGLKIDCEGAEYGIVNRLAELPITNRVDWIMMEWHEKGPDLLTKPLAAHGFSILSLLPHSKGTGMIYAFRHS